MADLTKLKQIANEAAEIEDQTEVKTSFDFRLPVAGKTVARLAEYIDFGAQPRKPYKGKEKPPADTVRIAFELLHPEKNIFDIEGRKMADRISITLTKSLSDKAGFKKLFNTMVAGRDSIKHMAQMIGDAFIVTVVHSGGEKGDDGKEKPKYANLRSVDGTWLIEQPFVEDPIAGTKTPVPVLPLVGEARLFVWDLANKEMWDSLFIEGEREIDDGKGGKTVRSKNWLQEKILGATNFEGSPISQVLSGLDLNLPTAQAQQPAPQVTAPPPAAGPDPRLAALIAAGFTLEQAQAALAAQAGTPAPQAQEAAPKAAPKAAKGRGKGKANDAPTTPATPAQTAQAAPPAAAPTSAADALAALGL